MLVSGKRSTKYNMKIEGTMLTKKSFTKMVEENVSKTRMSYIDSIVYLCEQNNIEIEDVKKYIVPSIANKIEVEAQNLNFLPKDGELPFDD